MTTLTRYCKALPTPIDELNPLGKTQIEMFLSAYTPIFHNAVQCETVNFILSGVDFNKSKWRTHLQENYGISARHMALSQPPRVLLIVQKNLGFY
jgi:hypothetical protein